VTRGCRLTALTAFSCAASADEAGIADGPDQDLDGDSLMQEEAR
jgi:hypothetical protein